MLRRRLLRSLKLIKLRDTVARIECWLSGSSLESMLTMHTLARRHFPRTYREILRLRFPPYIKLILDNPFPRTTITTAITRGEAIYYGPFRSRAVAEQFESQFLDLFQLRRCPEDLQPSAEHPGCIYGEMGMCLRPCQQIVGIDEYHHETVRVSQFLSTGGRSLRDTVLAARERFSGDMEFEEAARQHKRIEKIEEVLKLRDDLACDIDRLHGVAVGESTEPESVDLRFVQRGFWQPAVRFALTSGESMDRRLREVVAALPAMESSGRERQEHLAILARWFYSSWRDGEWVTFDDPERFPYRKLVRAISKACKR